MNADGSGATRRTTARDLFSPDGRRIAFHNRDGGNWEIYVMNAAGEPPPVTPALASCK